MAEVVVGGGNGGSIPADYVVVVSGSTVYAYAVTPGLATYSGPTTDAAPVIQQAANALIAANVGGAIVFKQPLTFATQLKIVPNIALMGIGGYGYLDSGVGPYGPVITSTYNGSTILVTGDVRGSTFPYLANFELVGSHAFASQNGILIDDTGGTVRDVFLDNIFIDNMGQHGLVLNGTGGTGIKVHANRLYSEICGGNGIDCSGSANGNTIDLIDPYIAGNTGFGFVTPAVQFNTKIMGGRFSSNVGGGVSIAANVNQFGIIGTEFDGNGDSTHPQILCNAAANGSARVLIEACSFNSGAVTNHIKLAATNAVNARILGCGFYNSIGDAVAWTSRSNNNIVVRNCSGYNDTRGKITNWLSGTQIGTAGNSATPVASTDYIIEGTDVYLTATAGTGVSIAIKDSLGNTLSSGAATFTGLIPAGYKINFGAFSVAPTVVVAVI